MAGGVGDYTASLRLALAAMGLRTSVLASHGAEGEDVRTVPGWNWLTVARVLRAVRRDRATVVHVQYQSGAFGMRPAVNLLPSIAGRRVPVVTTFHDLRAPYLFPKAGRLRTGLVLRMARGSAAVAVTNPADERALANVGVHAVRIPIGPNLPPPGPIQQVNRETVAFFGFPARSKGIDGLISALGGMEASRPALILVGAQGEPGSSNDVIDACVIDRLAAGFRVTLSRTGFLPARQASDALASAGAIVLPFRGGASQRSGTLLAALQSGRPVVTTEPRERDDLGDLAGLPQLLLAPAGDVHGLQVAIERALEWDGAAAPLPPAYRWQSIATEHLALYQRVLGAKS
jgi:glycosyltransferase involved in cell wall biosynthesis